ncbi:MAG: hypothetical protein AAGF77_05775 [Bacteroidota bacterium]
MRQMKKVVFGFLVLLTALGYSQYIVDTPQEVEDLKKLPQEKAYLSYTGPVVFSGEYLYYNFYCFNAQNSRRSATSRVGYVALVNDQGDYVLEQKIKLQRGLGQGDFFVTTEIPSGHYKLLAYTQWMKNNGLAQVFKGDLAIINPYLGDQSGLEIATDTMAITQMSPLPPESKSMDNSTLDLTLEKDVFGSREQVKLSLTNFKGELGAGAYTVKVAKRDVLNNAISTMNATAFATSYLNVPKQVDLQLGDSLFLPEQRGALLFGHVKHKETGLPGKDLPVVVSFPGTEFLLKFATTDANGNFYTYLRKDYKDAKTMIQVAENSDEYIVTLGRFNKLDASTLDFKKVPWSTAWADEVKTRSVQNQIENQFFTLKPDSLLLGDPIDPFDGGIPKIFALDDYTRFPTFQETLVEILNNAGYRSDGKGGEYIRIAQDFEKFNEAYNDYPAIVLFDGVFISDHATIKTFDARRIEKIRVVQDQFRLAGKDYQGMMAVETFEGDYYDEHQPNNGLKTAWTMPTPKKNYYKQTYTADGATAGRIPDYRTVLLWEPSVIVEGAGQDFSFFTSDVKGTFEVVLDGFTSYGKPIYLSKTLVVE